MQILLDPLRWVSHGVCGFANGCVFSCLSTAAPVNYENIIVEKKDGIAVITLNRPKALNALCDALMAELSQAVTALDKDDEVGAIVVTGSEKAFAGA